MSIRHLRQSVSRICRQELWYSARMSAHSIITRDKAMQMLKAKLKASERAGAGGKGVGYPW